MLNERKEILTSIIVYDDCVPPLFFKNENNIPEHILPGSSNLLSKEEDRSVVFTQLCIPETETVGITQAILDQWENNSDASILFPNKYGEDTYAQIVGFNSPINSRLKPGYKTFRVFFMWDKQITYNSYKND